VGHGDEFLALVRGGGVVRKRVQAGFIGHAEVLVILFRCTSPCATKSPRSSASPASGSSTGCLVLPGEGRAAEIAARRIVLGDGERAPPRSGASRRGRIEAFLSELVVRGDRPAAARVVGEARSGSVGLAAGDLACEHESEKRAHQRTAYGDRRAGGKPERWPSGGKERGNPGHGRQALEQGGRQDQAAEAEQRGEPQRDDRGERRVRADRRPRRPSVPLVSSAASVATACPCLRRRADSGRSAVRAGLPAL
jgi:hypothetical protein